MGSIYQHSYLTISATWASSGSNGCFHERSKSIELLNGIFAQVSFTHGFWSLDGYSAVTRFLQDEYALVFGRDGVSKREYSRLESSIMERRKWHGNSNNKPHANAVI
jgi:hypothetical protein